MDIYFKIKTFTEFIIPVLIIILLLLGVMYSLFKDWLKGKLMERLGYTHDRRLGDNVAYEFQPHWVKGDTQINCKRIKQMKYFKIKSFVHSIEKK